MLTNYRHRRNYDGMCLSDVHQHHHIISSVIIARHHASGYKTMCIVHVRGMHDAIHCYRTYEFVALPMVSEMQEVNVAPFPLIRLAGVCVCV